MDDLYQMFDFVTNADGEIMLLIFAAEVEPENPMFEVDKAENTLWVYRTSENAVGLCDIEPQIIEKLSKLKTLLVCEMNLPPANEKSEIVYVYEAKLL